MPKQTFSDEVLAVWGQIEGRKKLGISSARTENLTDILKREIGLEPALMRFGEEFKPWDLDEFLAAGIPQRQDGWCQVYYIPQDCEAATGSKAHNWMQWASRLLDYGRKSHKFAPKVKVGGDLLTSLRAKGFLTERQYTGRFLSLEAVVFYIASQVRTWSEPNCIMRVKDFIEKQDITTLGFIATAEEIDMDNLFTGGDDAAQGTNGGGAPITPKTRVPKAGQGLVGYNPSEAKSGVEVGSVDDILDGDDETKSVDSILDHLVDPEPEPSDDEIEAQIAALQAKLEARKLERVKERLEAEASKGMFVEGEVCEDKAQWNIVRIKYADGQVVNYLRQEASAG